MPRSTTSPWDFSGELFPPEAVRKVYTVAALTAGVRQLLEKNFGQVWVTGEITNLRAQSSGHVYFTLKDSQAQLNCVVFRNDAAAGKEALQDGRQVVLKGEMTVYEPRGQYQLRVLAVELHGVGALQVAFEKLKEKLAVEGLFDLARKRPLPRFPARIGLVTSPTGAAIRDVLTVVQRRNPALEMVFVPCAVQGAGAAGEIAAALDMLNQWSSSAPARLDLILLTRGGGSLEDLWAFNEEVVARAIHRSKVPVVSAVGHEIDFTISDFTADLRAATPSAAAEIITEGVFAGARWLTQAGDQLRDLAMRKVEGEKRHQGQLARRLASLHPRRSLNQRWQRIDDLATASARNVHRQIQQTRIQAQNLGVRLDRLRPDRVLAQRKADLDAWARKLGDAMRLQLRLRKQRFDGAQNRLRLLGPEQVLARGYSITQDAQTGAIIRSGAQTRPGQELRTKLHQGEVRSVVERRERNP